MPITRFTAYVSGDNPDEIADLAEKAANEFFDPLPGKFHATETEISFDPEAYRRSVERALTAAEEKLAALPEDEREGVEVVADRVPKYDGWVIFVYDTDQTQPKKSIAEVQAENAAIAANVLQSPTTRPETDPKYQDSFE